MSRNPTIVAMVLGFWVMSAGLVGCQTKDVTPPRVVSLDPAEGATGARLDRPFVAEFSEPLDPASVNAQAVELTVDGAPLAYVVELSDDGRRLRLWISEQPPRLPATVTVELKEAIRDPAGNRLQPRRWSFELADWVPLGGVLNRDPAHDVSSLDLTWWNGPLVVWGEVDPDTGDASLYAARWNDDAGRWEPLGERLNISPQTSCDYPSVAVFEGDPWVGFQCFVRGKAQIRAARWDGGDWQRSDALNHDPDRPAFTPLLAAGSDLYGAWREWDTQSSSYTLVWSAYHGAWSPGRPDVVSGTPLSQWDFTAHGATLWAAYTDESGGPAGAVVDEGNGQGWTRLGGGPLDGDGQQGTLSGQVRLTVAPSGELHALWKEGGAVYAARWSGGSWVSIGDRVSTTTRNYPHDAVFAGGTLWVLLADGALEEVYLRYWDEDATAWKNLAGAIYKENRYEARVTFSPGGWPMVAWTAMDPEGVVRLYVVGYNHVLP
ncbi:Ig-like domain-containing protein [Oceanithermus desulfurans]|uniref:SbsA Ig-like domain-containing protein n=2 Tax=Oceanithermus desulfurans TaxID=227924 RepID=A0A511RLC3_9DEIN|nr:Ig-like domain-containing protein [Oceanithermus desulfurans]MBB6029073.1 hypothetical protein [Oceanithermus desulfurans]GEM90464.1 hypothetical protein ODE01S_18980 [Oceanithermus desulfurans NBRC 100063]